MSALDRVTDISAEATSLRLTKEDIDAQGLEVAQEEIEALDMVAQSMGPSIEEMRLLEPDTTWVPGETVVGEDEVVPTQMIARRYLAFQIADAEAQPDGSELHEVRAIYIREDGQLEVLSTLGTVPADGETGRLAGTWYGDELNELPDLNIAPDEVLAARGRHLLTRLTPALMIDGPGFSATRMMDAMSVAIERAQEDLSVRRTQLLRRASALNEPKSESRSRTGR